MQMRRKLNTKLIFEEKKLNVNDIENVLSDHNKKTLDIDEYKQYMKDIPMYFPKLIRWRAKPSD